jgi:lysozyme
VPSTETTPALHRLVGRRVLAVLVAALTLVTVVPAAALAATGAATGRVPASRLALSPQGASFIATFEGFVATPYNDPGGHCTIGFGHLIHRGPCTDADRATWGTITRKRGLAMLRSDADSFAAGLRSRLATVRLNQGEFDALVSFTYNIGLGNFDDSSVKRDLLATPVRYRAVPKHLKLWVYSGGQFLCGLYRRRVNEGHLFSTGSYRISTPDCPSGATPATGPQPSSPDRPTVAPGTPT